MTERITAKTLVVEETVLCNDAGSRCEDCPDINYDPPRDSDCQYFEVQSGVPVCTREDGTQSIAFQHNIIDF